MSAPRTLKARRARLLPVNPELTPTRQETGRSGRYRRCAAPECGVKRERHFRWHGVVQYHPYCDACRQRASAARAARRAGAGQVAA